jgi:predicted HD phosphohydrolase
MLPALICVPLFATVVHVVNVEFILSLLEGTAGVFVDGEIVDQREHSLQCAQLAASEGATPGLIVACALHDIGHNPSIARIFRNLPHEEAGARLAGLAFGSEMAWVIGQHVAAKRYLVATDATYRRTLSEGSIRSLEHQGGPMTRVEVLAFEAHPWANDAVHLRRWDDRAKVPGAQAMSSAELSAIMSSVLRRPR